MARPKHDFLIHISTNNKFYWVYYDGNYEALSSSELYDDEAGARRGLANFLTEMRNYLNK